MRNSDEEHEHRREQVEVLVDPGDRGRLGFDNASTAESDTRSCGDASTGRAPDLGTPP